MLKNFTRLRLDASILPHIFHIFYEGGGAKFSFTMSAIFTSLRHWVQFLVYMFIGWSTLMTWLKSPLTYPEERVQLVNHLRGPVLISNSILILRPWIQFSSGVVMAATLISTLWFVKVRKTGGHDPLGQTHSPACSDNYFHATFV